MMMPNLPRLTQLPRCCIPAMVHKGRAGIFALVLLATGCATQPPPAAEQLNADHQARAQQLMRIASVTRDGGDLATAAQMYERAANYAPESAAPLVALGDTLLALRAHDRAAVAYQAALKIDPDRLEAHLGYGRSLLALGHVEAARAEFDAVLASDPTHAAAHNGRGLALAAAGDLAGALDTFEAGLAAQPADAALRSNHALTLSLAGRHAEAIAALKPLAEAPGASASRRQNLVLAYVLAGERERAAQIARRDLPADTVANNLAFYDALKGLSPAERARRILGMPETTIPQTATP